MKFGVSLGTDPPSLPLGNIAWGRWLRTVHLFSFSACNCGIWANLNTLILPVCLQSPQTLSGWLDPQTQTLNSLQLPHWPCFTSCGSLGWPLDTSLRAGFQRGGSGAFKSLYTRELKCHGLKNIQPWYDEYFTVGIFLVSVVSLLGTQRSTYWKLADEGGKAEVQEALLPAVTVSLSSTLTWVRCQRKTQVWWWDFAWC